MELIQRFTTQFQYIFQTASKFLGYKNGAFPETEKQSKRILTLPVNQYIKKKEILFICRLINNFYS